MPDVPRGGMAAASGLGAISGLGSRVRDLFKGATKDIHTPTEKPKPRDIQPQYRFEEPVDRRLLILADYYYREG